MRIRIRTILVLFAISALSAAGPSVAQSSRKPAQIGALINGLPPTPSAVHPINELRKGLAALDYRDGTDYVLDARYAEGRLDRLPGFATELAAKNVDVIVVYGGPAMQAARTASRTIPIVAAIVADPVAVGIAASFDRSGGNVTGITSDDPDQPRRQLELLRQIRPGLTRVAIIGDASIPGADASGLAPIERVAVAAARNLGMDAQVLRVRGPSVDWDGTFRTITEIRAEALLVPELPVAFGERMRIAAMASAQRLPSAFWAAPDDTGALIAYGTTVVDTWVPVASIVDRILKGANPAEMAFQRVTRRILVVNKRVAQALELDVPPEVLRQADRVID